METIHSRKTGMRALFFGTTSREEFHNTMGESVRLHWGT